ncbi:hypothetical protein GH714_025436 [Hevea brasiliensis]|uniref:40S ribosomal protein S8 n=1 Tax=Hevea brasiliensis TaxID=3981 RepID=A0A6A6KWZ8_HEVBR|nr:hypothetical protein GH714_025436 [Hevea brasiliensis]
MEEDFDLPTEDEDHTEEDFDLPTGDEDMDLPNDSPILKVGEEKEIGKQGLKKKLIKEGEGWDTPEKGDEVEGQVIKGWDQGIKTMKKGENAIFTVPPDLAYGASGSKPTIPPNATLQFDVELLSWISVKDIYKDGGIFKNILVKGENWEKPDDLDEVFVKYEVWLEDRTVAKSDGIEFTVEEGFLSCIVKGCQDNEERREGSSNSEATMPASGDEVAVPPNATLHITLELVSWKTVSEVISDKKVIKKILKEGEGYERPSGGAVVKLKLIGKLQDGTVFLKKGHNNEDELFEFKTDEEQVIDGLDRAVMLMKKGEVALVTIAPEYAFGSSESQQGLAVVPPNSTVCYEVELVSFVQEKGSWEMNIQEKIEAAGKKKEEGNVLFKGGEYARASKRYEKAVKYIEYTSSYSDEEKKQANALKVACNLNNAACELKLKEYTQAEKLCTKVLEIESRNVKALYRRAQAYIQLADLDLAEFDIKKALEIDPRIGVLYFDLLNFTLGKTRDVKLEYKKLKEKMREYIKKEAKFYGNMIAKMNKLGPIDSIVSPETPCTRGAPLVARRRLGGRREKVIEILAHMLRYELGRQPANTKLSSNKTVRRVRVRGGNVKWRALRLDTGNYSWGSEAVTRKTRILDVVYNASNNELVRTQTLVKSAIVQVDAAPFKQWYLQHYGIDIGRKKKTVLRRKLQSFILFLEGEGAAAEETKKSNHVERKLEKRQKDRKLDPHIEDQFGGGRLLACISSRPGQCGRADGYILEGKELEFYMKKLQRKKGKGAGAA